MLELLNQKITLSMDFFVLVYFALFVFFSMLLAFMLGYILGKLRSKESSSIPAESYQRSLQILDLAKKEALKIYRDSQAKAKKIVEDAYDIKTQTKSDFREHLNTVSQAQLDDFESFLKKEIHVFEDTIAKEGRDSLKILDNLSKDLKKEVTSSIEDLKTNIVKETLESSKLVDAKVSQEYSEIEQEINKYKEEQLNKINDRLTNLLAEVASKSLGVSFSVNQHQEVIMNMLEDAKKKDLLGL